MKTLAEKCAELRDECKKRFAAFNEPFGSTAAAYGWCANELDEIIRAAESQPQASDKKRAQEFAARWYVGEPDESLRKRLTHGLAGQLAGQFRAVRFDEECRHMSGKPQGR